MECKIKKSKSIRNNSILLVLLLCALWLPIHSSGATKTASVSGAWSNTATWGGAAAPVSGGGDDIVINTGITVTMDAAYSTTGSLTMTTTAILDLNSYNATFANIASSAATGTIINNAAGTGTATLNITAFTTTISCLVKDGATAKVAVKIANTNTSAQLFPGANANTFSGGLTLANNATGTRMRVTGAITTVGSAGAITSSPYGTGAIYVGESATDKAGILFDTYGSNTLANAIVINTNLGTDRPGIRVDAAATGLTLSGAITANLADLKIHTPNGHTTAVSLTGKITGTYGVNVDAYDGGNLTVTLNNAGTANDYSGTTSISHSGCTLKLGRAAQITDGSAVTVTGKLEMNGFDETVGSITGAGTIDNNSGTGTYTLTSGGNGSTTTFSGTLGSTSGKVAITKNGVGTLTLSGGNIDYTGPSTVNAGTLKITDANNFGQGSTDNDFYIESGAVLEFNTVAQNITLGSDADGGLKITGTGTLRKTGAGALVLGGQGNSSFVINFNMTDGLIDIQGGSVWNGGWQGGVWTNNKTDLNIDAGALLTLHDGYEVYCDALTGAGTISRNGTLGGSFGITVGVNNGSGTFSGLIEDDGNPVKFAKIGSGTQYLTGNNTYTGATTISGGVLAIGNNTTTGAIAGASIVNNATLAFYRSDAYTYAGVISGTGFVAKGYAGTTTLTGTNTYTGQTQITNGTLQIGNGGTTGSISSTSLIDLGSSDNSQSLVFNRSDNITYSQVIQGGHSDLLATVKQLGAGILTLSGTNTYVGDTRISAGTISATNTSAFGTSNIFVDGATLEVLHNGSGNDGTITFANVITVTNGYTSTINVNNNGSNTGNGIRFSRLSQGSGTQVNLTGGNGYYLTFATDLNLISTAGTAILNPTTAYFKIPAVTNNNAIHTLQLDGTWVGGDYTTSNRITGVAQDNGFQLTVTKENTSVWNLEGANTYSGGTTISGGILRCINDDCYGTNTVTINAGGAAMHWGASALTIPNNFIVNGSSGDTDYPTINHDGGGGLVTLNGTITLNADAEIGVGGCSWNDMVINGVISSSGAYTLTVDEANALCATTQIQTLTLAGTNTYTGATIVTGGTLKLANAAALGTAAAGTTINDGAAMDLNGITYTTAEPLTINGTGISSGGAIFNSSTTQAQFQGVITLGSNSSIIATNGGIVINSAGNITGTGFDLTLGGSLNGNLNDPLNTSTGGTVTKIGTGAWTLNQANNYTGLTTISAGRLALGDPNALGTVDAGTVVESGGMLDLIGVTYAAAEPLTLNGNGGGAGVGALRNTSASAATFPGLITLGNAATITAESGDINITHTGTITGATFGLTLAGDGDGSIASIIGTTTGTLTKQDAGTWTLSGANTYTGATTVNAGTLLLTVDNQQYGTIGYTSSLTINGGTVQATKNNALFGWFVSNTNPVTINSGGVLTTSNLVTAWIRGTVTLAGGTIASGTPNATYGSWYFQDDFTVIGNATSTISATEFSIHKSGGTTFDVSDGTADVDLLITGTLIPGDGGGENLIKAGVGLMELRGANTYTASTMVNAGTLRLGSTSALGTTAGATTIASGAALDLNGITYSTAEPLTVSGTGVSSSGVIYNSSGTNSSFAGAITLGAASTFTAGNQITLSGNITPSTQSLTKAGANSLIFGSNSVTVDDFTISAGTLNAGASTINIYGNFANSGTFTKGTSTVDMKGGSAQNLDDATFNNLTISNTSGGVQLTNNITVDGTLTMSSGVLTTTGAYSITLGSSGSINETTPSATAPTSYVTGSISTTRTVLQSVANTFGGMGLSITEDNIASNSTQVTRVTGTALSGGGGNLSIKRYFIITPTTDVGLDATLLFNYFDNEISGHTEANLILFKSNDGGSTWQGQGSSLNAGSNELSLSGITSFSHWTASDNVGAPLPVELLRFEGNNSGGVQRLEWATASEINSAYFEVLRSTDGYRYDTVGKVASTGHSSEINTYGFKDNYGLWGAVYYMLVEYDTDGNTTVLDKLVLYPGESAVAGGYKIFPNPAKDRAYFSWQVKQYTVYSLEGNLVLSGNGSEIMNLGSLAPGHYMVHADQQTPLRLIVVD